MLRTGQKFSWTKSELELFRQLENLEMAAMCMADSYMGGVTVGSPVYLQMEEMGRELDMARATLRERMGTTRFNEITRYGNTTNAWRKELYARYVQKHPEYEPEERWV